MKEITEYRIGRVVITFKDCLTRTGYRFFENLFKKYGVSIVVVNDFTQEKVEDGKRREVKFSGKRTYRGLFHDLKLNKVFNADLNGALNILKAGAKLHEWALPLKISLFKLATPIRMNLDAFYYKVTCESLRG